MTRSLLLLLLLLPGVAAAQTPITCTASCPPIRYFESVACSSGSCTRAAPVAADFSGGTVGLALTSTSPGWGALVCAPEGQTLTGVGELRVYSWYPWLSGEVVRSYIFDRSMSELTSTTACSGAGCECVTLSDVGTGPRLPRRLLLVPVDVGVSGGTGLRVYLFGQ